MTQDEFNAWIRARFNLWTKSDVDAEIRKSVEQALAQRTWVGLTDEDDIDWNGTGNLKQLVEAVEAKLKDKNS